MGLSMVGRSLCTFEYKFRLTYTLLTPQQYQQYAVLAILFYAYLLVFASYFFTTSEMRLN